MTAQISVRELVEEQLSASVWAVGEVIDRCRTLPPGHFHGALAVGPGSLAETLWHIIDAMFYFADGFAGRAYFDVGLTTPHDTPDALRALLDRAEVELRRSIADRLVQRPGDAVRLPAADREIPLASAIAQVFDHASYHRAQCAHMLKRLGAFEPPLEVSPLDRAIAQD